ncbi:MAG TPA: MFS transporter [Desulfobacteraceae bacterium]|nr:MFS transporter [Desulfobacteraceae bacterium]HPJ66237.1 MFS transporter [Desulfobacteraceae bacterium]HPQ27168.1 MFS transporter [Desulfobacteraceae bacterium]
MESNNLKLWNRRFIFLNLSFFLIFSNISFLYLYPLVLDTMGENHNVIGLTMGIFSIAAVISRPYMGKLVALKGEYNIMSYGIAAILLSSLGYNLLTDFGPVMLIIRIIHGLGFSAFISGSFSFAAKTFQPERRGEGFSLVGASIMAAVSLAPAFGEFLIKYWGFNALYLAASGTIVLAWFTAFGAVKHPIVFQLKKEKKAATYRNVLKNRSFIFLLCSTFIFSHCQATVLNFIVLISAEYGTPSGPFFFSSYLTAIIILLSMGKLFDHFAKISFILLAYPFFAIGISIIPTFMKSSFFLIPALLYGLGVGFLFPPLNALAAGFGSEAEKPETMSVFTVVYDSGFITGAVISGWIASITSLDILFLSCGIFGAVGFLVVILFPIKSK